MYEFKTSDINESFLAKLLLVCYNGKVSKQQIIGVQLWKNFLNMEQQKLTI